MPQLKEKKIVISKIKGFRIRKRFFADEVSPTSFIFIF
jgi:hypothetical protein